MPSRAKKLDRAVAKLPSIPRELVDQFLSGPMSQEAINAAGLAFKQALIEASLSAELSRKSHTDEWDRVDLSRPGSVADGVAG